MSVAVQGDYTIIGLDIFKEAGGRYRPLARTVKGVEVTDGVLAIQFAAKTGLPCISGIVVRGEKGDIRKINCAGPAVGDFEAGKALTKAAKRPRSLPADDFYADWAAHLFGPEAGPAVAKVFASIDGNLPRPSRWGPGPGQVREDRRPWSEAKNDYAFVEQLEALRPTVRGKGNRARFDYWLSQLRFLRAQNRVGCAWEAYRLALADVEKIKDPQKQRAAARKTLLPLRVDLVRAAADSYSCLLAAVSTPGELGTLANWEQHCMSRILGLHGDRLAKLLGVEELPEEALPRRTYDGPARLIVPVARSSIEVGVPLGITAMVLDDQRPESVVLKWRPIGAGPWQTVPAENVARAVYRVTLPAQPIETGVVEYCIEAKTGDGELLVFPATAPQISQTVVVTGPPAGPAFGDGADR